MEKDRLWISPHDRRRSRVLRKRLEANPDDTIPDHTLAASLTLWK
jgi:hypothetical protein